MKSLNEIISMIEELCNLADQHAEFEVERLKSELILEIKRWMKVRLEADEYQKVKRIEIMFKTFADPVIFNDPQSQGFTANGVFYVVRDTEGSSYLYNASNIDFIREVR